MDDHRPTNTLDILPIIEKQRLGKFWITLFVVSWILTFLDGFDFQIISFAGRYIKKAFELTDTQFGMLGTIGLFGTLIGGLTMGFLADRIGRRLPIIICTVGFGVFMLLFATAQDYGQLVALRFIAGLFLGGVLPLAWALNTEYAPAKYRSTSVVVVMVGYSLGSAAGGPMSNLLIPKYGWQSVFIVGGLCSLAAVVAVVLALPESVKFLAEKDMKRDRIAATLRKIDPSIIIAKGTRFVVGTASTKTSQFNVKDLFTDRLSRISPMLWLAYMTSSAVVFYLVFWTPIINERLGFSVSTAVTIAAIAGVAGAVGQIVIGRFIDKRGVGTIAVMPVLAVPCLLAIGMFDLSKPAYITVLLLANVFIIGGHGGMHSISGIFYRPAIRANGAGWATSMAKFGAMLGPWLAGALMDGGFSAKSTFFVFAFFPLAMSMLLVAIGRIQASLPAGTEGAPNSRHESESQAERQPTSV